MKKALLAGAVLGALGGMAGSAMAQSNVTLYGVFDTAYRRTTNVNANGDTLNTINGGLIQGSRWGVRGAEDLGDGLKAIFDLQSGFNPVTGASAQQGQLFSRQAWVGLEGGFGKLTLGRQFGVAFDQFGAFDPYGIGNASQIAAMQYDLFGARFDNTVKYAKKIGIVNFTVAHSMGERAANASAGDTTGIGLDLATGAFTFNSAYQQSSDIADRKSKAAVVGGTYTVGAAKIYAGYARNTRDRGFAACANNNATTLGAVVPAACVSASNPNGTNGSLSNTNLAPGSSIGDAKTDLFLVGAQYNLTEKWQVVGAYMDSKTRIDGAPDAHHKAAYAVLDYYFSKRTDVYVSLDRHIASNYVGAYDSSANGNRPTTGFMAGMRHRF